MKKNTWLARHSKLGFLVIKSVLNCHYYNNIMWKKEIGLANNLRPANKEL